MFGPGKTNQAYSADKHGAMNEVIQATKIYALTFANLLGNTT